DVWPFFTKQVAHAARSTDSNRNLSGEGEGSFRLVRLDRADYKGEPMLPIVALIARRIALCAVSAVVLLSTAACVSAAPAAAGEQVAALARQYVGSRYLWGGTSPVGF